MKPTTNMIPKIGLLLLLLLKGGMAFAQEISQDELNPDQSGAEGLDVSAFEFGDGSKSVSLRAVSLRQYCPPVRTQVGLPTGVQLGLAFGYGAMTILKAKQNKWSGAQLQQEAFSAFFPFETLPKNETNCQVGSEFLRDINTILTGVGNVKAAGYDGTSTNCRQHPVERWTQQAARYRIDRIERVFDQQVSDEQKEFSTKQSLQAGSPVVAIVKIDQGFRQLRGDTWQPNGIQPGWQVVVVVGYDDNRQAFEIFNSMGSGWGNRGFAWIRYDDFFRWTKVAVQLKDHPDEKITPAPTHTTVVRRKPAVLLRGSGTMQEVVLSANGQLQATPIAVTHRGTYYETRQAFAVQSQMRFVSQQLPRFGYVYLFSVDGNKKAELHFPVRGESAYVADDESRLVFPRPIPVRTPDGRLSVTEQGFQKEVNGADWFVVLYAKQPLSPTLLAGWLNELAVSGGAFMPTLERVLGARLVPWRFVNFSDQAMRFTVQSTQGDIVPLVLKINGN